MQDKPSYKKDSKKRLVAYVDNEPVGTVDVIITDETIEIDSFGVIEQFQDKVLDQQYKHTHR